MGWTGHELPAKNWVLYTRGGLEGVYLQRFHKSGDGTGQPIGPAIHIPRDLLIMLAASEVRRARERRIEELSDEEVLGIAEGTSDGLS